MNEPAFSDQWFRKRFRDDLGFRNFQGLDESREDSFIRLSNWLQLNHVTLSLSGKMAYDRNGRANNLTNLYWKDREQFVDWARATKQPIFKKRGAKAVHGGRVTTPATKKPAKPKVTGWDDFDWSV